MFEDLSSAQKSRATVHRDVRAMCVETCHFLGLEITTSAMEIVAELVYKKLRIFGRDLEAFAKHAKRNTVNPEDVKLLVRRNPSLKTHITNLAGMNPAKEKKRKTVVQTEPVAQPTTATDDAVSNESFSTERASSKNDDGEAMIVDDVVDLTFD